MPPGQGRKPNKTKTELLTLSLSDGDRTAVDALVQLDRFGKTRQEVILHLLRNSIHALYVDGTLKKKGRSLVTRCTAWPGNTSWKRRDCVLGAPSLLPSVQAAYVRLDLQSCTRQRGRLPPFGIGVLTSSSRPTPAPILFRRTIPDETDAVSGLWPGQGFRGRPAAPGRRIVSRVTRTAVEGARRRVSDKARLRWLDAERILRAVRRNVSLGSAAWSMVTCEHFLIAPRP